MNVKRIRVKREPEAQRSLQEATYDGHTFRVGDAVAVIGYVGYWRIERYEIDDEGHALAVTLPIPDIFSPEAGPRKKRLSDMVALSEEHINFEIERIEKHLDLLHAIANRLWARKRRGSDDDAAFQ